MYADDMLFVSNEADRYSIGDTTDGLCHHDDGSLTIYIQHARPDGDRAANWLPAPNGSFNLTMRYYGPLTPVLDNTYALPSVRRVTRGAVSSESTDVVIGVDD